MSSYLQTQGVPWQESEIISNKTDNDGHHYLKVLLLSNKKSRNNWIAPYEKIGDLSKETLDSFLGLPRIDEHSYPYFLQLKDKLERQGKSDEEIVATLKAESRKLGLDYIDHVFTDDPNSPLLYGQLKVMDRKENEYIEKHGRPSKNFTSPAVYGTADVTAEGTDVYHMDTLRAFHLASVNIPAFPPEEAKVKGVCEGNSESCRKVLAVAGFDSVNYPQLAKTDTPLENVNNTCSCKNNIEMSQQTPELNVTSTAPNPVNYTLTTGTTTTDKLIPGAQNTTAEAVAEARKEAQKVIDENNKAKEQQDKTVELSQVEIDLKAAKKDLETANNEKNEMKNFFLEKLLIAAIPKENFKKEDEYTTLKDSTKGLILKYNMTLEDADWFIGKVSKSVPSPAVSTEPEDKTRKTVGVSGFLGTNYNSDFLTQSYQRKKPTPQSGNSSGIADEEYPINF